MSVHLENNKLAHRQAKAGNVAKWVLANSSYGNQLSLNSFMSISSSASTPTSISLFLWGKKKITEQHYVVYPTVPASEIISPIGNRHHVILFSQLIVAGLQPCTKASNGYCTCFFLDECILWNSVLPFVLGHLMCSMQTTGSPV